MPQYKLFVFVYLSLFGFLGCQPKDKFEWNAGMSAPKFYGNGGPYVSFYYQGKSVAGVSAGSGISPGWGQTSGGYTGGENFKPVPDSVYVRWICAADRYSYEGRAKLPRERMLELFRTPNCRCFQVHHLGLFDLGGTSFDFRGVLIEFRDNPNQHRSKKVSSYLMI